MVHGLSIAEVAERCRRHIGETFTYRSRYEYPHGRMVRATLKAVNERDVTIEVEFTDGFRADYCTMTGPFYENVIMNIEH